MLQVAPKRRLLAATQVLLQPRVVPSKQGARSRIQMGQSQRMFDKRKGQRLMLLPMALTLKLLAATKMVLQMVLQQEAVHNIRVLRVLRVLRKQGVSFHWEASHCMAMPPAAKPSPL